MFLYRVSANSSDSLTEDLFVHVDFAMNKFELQIWTSQSPPPAIS